MIHQAGLRPSAISAVRSSVLSPEMHEDVTGDQYVAFAALMASGLINYRQVMKMAIEAGFAGVLGPEHHGGDGLSVHAPISATGASGYCWPVTPGQSHIRPPHWP